MWLFHFSYALLVLCLCKPTHNELSPRQTCVDLRQWLNARVPLSRHDVSSLIILKWLDEPVNVNMTDSPPPQVVQPDSTPSAFSPTNNDTDFWAVVINPNAHQSEINTENTGSLKQACGLVCVCQWVSRINQKIIRLSQSPRRVNID